MVFVCTENQPRACTDSVVGQSRGSDSVEDRVTLHSADSSH